MLRGDMFLRQGLVIARPREKPSTVVIEEVPNSDHPSVCDEKPSGDATASKPRTAAVPTGDATSSKSRCKAAGTSARRTVTAASEAGPMSRVLFAVCIVVLVIFGYLLQQLRAQEALVERQNTLAGKLRHEILEKEMLASDALSSLERKASTAQLNARRMEDKHESQSEGRPAQNSPAVEVSEKHPTPEELAQLKEVLIRKLREHLAVKDPSGARSSAAEQTMEERLHQMLESNQDAAQSLRGAVHNEVHHSALLQEELENREAIAETLKGKLQMERSSEQQLRDQMKRQAGEASKVLAGLKEEHAALVRQLSEARLESEKANERLAAETAHWKQVAEDHAKESEQVRRFREMDAKKLQDARSLLLRSKALHEKQDAALDADESRLQRLKSVSAQESEQVALLEKELEEEHQRATQRIAQAQAMLEKVASLQQNFAERERRSLQAVVAAEARAHEAEDRLEEAAREKAREASKYEELEELYQAEREKRLQEREEVKARNRKMMEELEKVRQDSIANLKALQGEKVAALRQMEENHRLREMEAEHSRQLAEVEKGLRSLRSERERSDTAGPEQPQRQPQRQHNGTGLSEQKAAALQQQARVFREDSQATSAKAHWEEHEKGQQQHEQHE